MALVVKSKSISVFASIVWLVNFDKEASSTKRRFPRGAQKYVAATSCAVQVITYDVVNFLFV